MRFPLNQHNGLDVIDYLSMKQHKDQYPYIKNLKDGIPLLQAAIDKAGLSNHIRVIFKTVPFVDKEK